MAKIIPKPHRPPAPLPAKEPTTPPRPLMKPKSEPAISLNGKPGSTGPIIACRKRSSISAKANSAVAAEMKKKEVAADIERKVEAAAGKEADDASVSVAAEPRVTKKRTMERTGGGARGTRTSKTRSNNASSVGGGGGRGSSGNPNSNPSPSSGGRGAAAKAESSEAKAEKKNATNSGVAKKRSAANFLSRVKRSLTSNGTLLDSLKGSSVGGNGNGNGNGRGSTTEQKKGGGGGKSEGRRDHGQRQGSNGKQQASAAEQSSGKRSVGRPPKHAAATPPPKQGKETMEAETKAPARKRARR